MLKYTMGSGSSILEQGCVLAKEYNFKIERLPQITGKLYVVLASVSYLAANETAALAKADEFRVNVCEKKCKLNKFCKPERTTDLVTVNGGLDTIAVALLTKYD